MALEEKCNYYFVVDCDNFIIPGTLKALMDKDKPIIAPMLRSIPNYLDHYSNFYCATDAKGYWIDHPDYMRILAQKKVGTFQVPVVHCTYLIQSKYLDQLIYIDGTADYEFVIFSREEKEKKIGQYICNEQAFGTLVHHVDGCKTLEEEKAILTQFFIMSEPWNRVNNERPDESSEEVFTRIYRNAEWGRNESGVASSGYGSRVSTTAPYVKLLRDFIQSKRIKSVVDLGCGDWEFTQHMNWEGIEYAGFDVVDQVIKRNIELFKMANIHFYIADIAKTDLPEADLLICKDVFQHIPHRGIFKIADQFNKYKYCIITNDVDVQTLSSNNMDILHPGGYRTLDLTKPPFNFQGKKILSYFSHHTVLKQVILLERN